MKVLVLLKCIGLLALRFIILQFLNVFFPAQMHNQNRWITILLSILTMLIIIFCVNRKYHFNFFQKNEKLGLQIILAIITGIGLSFFNTIAGVQWMLSGRDVIEPVIDSPLLFLLMVLLGAVVEEFFFRGILLNMCRSSFGKILTIMIPSIIFMVGHISPIMMIHTLVSGIVCGYFYYYSKHILIPVIIHAVNNFMWSSLLAGYIIEFTGSIFKVGYLAIGAIFIIIGLIIIVISKMFFDKLFSKDRIKNTTE